MKYQVASVTLIVGAAVPVVAWLAIAFSLLHLIGSVHARGHKPGKRSDHACIHGCVCGYICSRTMP